MDYLFLRARIYIGGEDYDAALRDLQQVNNFGAENVSLLNLTYAEAYIGKGDAKGATAYLDSAADGMDGSDVRLVAEYERLSASAATLVAAF